MFPFSSEKYPELELRNNHFNAELTGFANGFPGMEREMSKADFEQVE